MTTGIWTPGSLARRSRKAKAVVVRQVVIQQDQVRLDQAGLRQALFGVERRNQRMTGGLEGTAVKVLVDLAVVDGKE